MHPTVLGQCHCAGANHFILMKHLYLLGIISTYHLYFSHSVAMFGNINKLPTGRKADIFVEYTSEAINFVEAITSKTMVFSTKANSTGSIVYYIQAGQQIKF